MSKIKKFLEERLQKRTPKGIDPKKHERCVRDVKEQGHDVGSAHAICTASMKKAEEVKMPKKEFVKEHKRLLNVLNSPSHKDDKEEAKRQKQEMSEYTEKADPMDSTSQHLADKIRRHNQKKLHSFAKKHKIKKSIDFQETKTAVDSGDQLLAENTTSPELINYLKTSVDNEITKIPFSKGMLTVSQKEPGLYNAFFQDNQGQVIEKFDSQTLEIMAKNMMMKQLWGNAEPRIASPIAPRHDEVEEMEDRRIASQEAGMAIERHNAVYHQGQQPGEPIGGKAKTLKVRFGDFELELRKSVKDFVSDFKKAKYMNSDLVQKSIKTWRKKMEGCMNLQSDQEAAKILFNNWDDYQEDFCQIVYAMQQMNKYE
jgi:hypothetical protein